MTQIPQPFKRLISTTGHVPSHQSKPSTSGHTPGNNLVGRTGFENTYPLPKATSCENGIKTLPLGSKLPTPKVTASSPLRPQTSKINNHASKGSATVVAVSKAKKTPLSGTLNPGITSVRKKSPSSSQGSSQIRLSSLDSTKAQTLRGNMFQAQPVTNKTQIEELPSPLPRNHPLKLDHIVLFATNTVPTHKPQLHPHIHPQQQHQTPMQYIDPTQLSPSLSYSHTEPSPTRRIQEAKHSIPSFTATSIVIDQNHISRADEPAKDFVVHMAESKGESPRDLTDVSMVGANGQKDSGHIRKDSSIPFCKTHPQKHVKYIVGESRSITLKDAIVRGYELVCSKCAIELVQRHKGLKLGEIVVSQVMSEDPVDLSPALIPQNEVANARKNEIEHFLGRLEHVHEGLVTALKYIDCRRGELINFYKRQEEKVQGVFIELQTMVGEENARLQGRITEQKTRNLHEMAMIGSELGAFMQEMSVIRDDIALNLQTILRKVEPKDYQTTLWHYTEEISEFEAHVTDWRSTSLEVLKVPEDFFKKHWKKRLMTNIEELVQKMVALKLTPILKRYREPHFGGQSEASVGWHDQSAMFTTMGNSHSHGYESAMHAPTPTDPRSGLLVSFQNKEMFHGAIESSLHQHQLANTLPAAMPSSNGTYQSPAIPAEKLEGLKGSGSCSSQKTQLKYWSLLEKVSNNHTNYVSFYSDLIKNHISPPTSKDIHANSEQNSEIRTAQVPQASSKPLKENEKFAQFIESKLKTSEGGDDRQGQPAVAALCNKMLFASSPQGDTENHGVREESDQPSSRRDLDNSPYNEEDLVLRAEGDDDIIMAHSHAIDFPVQTIDSPNSYDVAQPPIVYNNLMKTKDMGAGNGY